MRNAARLLGAPVRFVLLSLVRLYRVSLGRVLPPRCRFHPTCSAYAEASLLRHGAGKGTVLAAWRVLRCNPLSAGGVDPVPEKGRWRAAGVGVTPSHEEAG